MPGSGAGLNRVGKNGGIVCLSFDSSVAAYTTPYTGYGLIGVNDSGPIMWEGAGFTKWTVQIIGSGAYQTGYEVSVYFTIDPVLLTKISSGFRYEPQYPTKDSGFFDQTSLSELIPASSWVLAPLQSATGGGPEANPFITGTNWGGFLSGGAIAIRMVLTNTDSPAAGTACTGLCMAVP